MAWAGYYPSTLPPPTFDGYTLDPADQVIRTGMEAGAPRVRRRSSALGDQLQLAWLFTDAEMRLFRFWLESRTGWSLLYPHDNFISGWTAYYATVGSTAYGQPIVAPDGVSAASYLKSTTVDNGHRVLRYPTLEDNTIYEFSIYAKAAERSFIRAYAVSKENTAASAFFNLSTGAVGLTAGPAFIGASIESAGNGWYRCSMLFTSSSGATSQWAAWYIGESDGVSQFPGKNDAGTAQSGGASSITLRAGASGTAEYYTGATVTITGGTGNGQARTITAYDGTSKIATVGTAWVTTPDTTSTYEVTDGLFLWGAQLTKTDSHLEFLPTMTDGRISGADGGAAWFRMPVAVGSGGIVEMECRLASKFSARLISGLNWQVTAAVEVR